MHWRILKRCWYEAQTTPLLLAFSTDPVSNTNWFWDRYGEDKTPRCSFSPHICFEFFSGCWVWFSIFPPWILCSDVLLCSPPLLLVYSSRGGLDGEGEDIINWEWVLNSKFLLKCNISVWSYQTFESQREKKIAISSNSDTLSILQFNYKKEVFLFCKDISEENWKIKFIPQNHENYCYRKNDFGRNCVFCNNIYML